MPILDPSYRIKVAINSSIINKNERGASFVKGFENVELTLEELAHEIDQGHAFTSQLSGPRNRASFVCSGCLTIDFDGSRHLDDVLDEPFVREHASLLYTTQRHTPDQNRFRILFALPEPIDRPAHLHAALRSLSLQLGGNRAPTQPAQLFFGSKGSSPKILHHMLSEEAVDTLIKRGFGADAKIQKDPTATTTVSRQQIDVDAAMTLDDGSKAELSKIPKGTRVCCPFHYDQNVSAFVTASTNGLNRGIHCAACVQTFWADDHRDEIDFFDFDRQVAEAERYFNANQDLGPLQTAISREFHPGLNDCRVSRQDGGFVELGKSLPMGLTFVKSPKGTGKTEALARILKDINGRVLLIGHRVALIDQTCNRLEIECYQDKPQGPIIWKKIGICLDSLQRLSLPAGPNATKPFIDYLIIDESEQVLAHFLSGTIKDGDRNDIFQRFRRLVRGARRVVVMDADINWVSFETLTKMASEPDKNYEPKPTTLFINEHKVSSVVEMYETKAELIGEIKSWALTRKRLFVPSNSKRQLSQLQKGFESDMPQVRTLLVTSDTTGEEAVKAFIANPKIETLKYDVIFASPTLGTGVDITFDDTAQHVDGVFGLFETSVSTHYEIDQQIWRVRHPKHVKVWVSPATHNFDTSLDVIKRDIQRGNLYKSVLSHYDDLVRPVYHTDDPLIDMAALIRSQQIASKNALRKHFIEMKKSHGHEVRYIQKSVDIHAAGRALAKLSKDLEEDHYANSMLSAPMLSREEFDGLERQNKLASLDRSGKLALERYHIERFYRQILDGDLIRLDERGKLRKRVMAFEAFRDAAHSADSANGFKAEIKDRFMPNRKAKGLLLHELLVRAGLIRSGELDTGVALSWKDLIDFTAFCVELRPHIENLLKVEVSPEPVKAIRQLADLLKVMGLSLTQTGSTRAKGVTDGQKVRFYRLNSEVLAKMQDIVRRRDTMPAESFAECSDPVIKAATEIEHAPARAVAEAFA